KIKSLRHTEISENPETWSGQELCDAAGSLQALEGTALTGATAARARLLLCRAAKEGGSVWLGGSSSSPTGLVHSTEARAVQVGWPRGSGRRWARGAAYGWGGAGASATLPPPPPRPWSTRAASPTPRSTSGRRITLAITTASPTAPYGRSSTIGCT